MGVPIATGAGAYVVGRAVRIMRGGGAGRVARCLAGTPDKPLAGLAAIEASNKFWIRVCPPQNVGGQTIRRSGKHEQILELPIAVEAQYFFHEGCQDDRLRLQPH